MLNFFSVLSPLTRGGFLKLLLYLKPPSDEGGVKTAGFDGRREKANPQSSALSQTTPPSQLCCDTSPDKGRHRFAVSILAPSDEGAVSR